MSHSTKGFLIFSVLILVSSCPAENADTASSVTVRLYSDVQLSTQTLSQAEQEATRIFRQAGIETVWVQCKPSPSPTDPRCEFPPGSKLLAMRIVPKALNAADSIFGMAFLSQEGHGAHGDVFYAVLRPGGGFDAPARVNDRPGSAIATGNVRGPHLALGRNARPHVAWIGSGARSNPRHSGRGR